MFKAQEAPANSGRSLALWAGGSYGFGVFRIENVPAEITQDLPANLDLEEGQPLELAIEATCSSREVRSSFEPVSERSRQQLSSGRKLDKDSGLGRIRSPHRASRKLSRGECSASAGLSSQ